MLHIKLKLTTFAATWQQIFCPQTHPRPRGWGQKVKPYIFVKVVMLHIKLKRIEHRAQCHDESKYAVITHTNGPWGGVKRSYYFSFLKVVMLHIKLKWKKCRPACKVTL